MDPRNQEIFNGIVRTVAAEEDVVIIDLARHVAENVEGWNEPMKIFYDGIHVTELGSRTYAEHIVDRLLETILSKRNARPGDAKVGTWQRDLLPLADDDEEAPLLTSTK